MFGGHDFFGGGGGFPFGGMGGPRGGGSKCDNKFYELLGVEKNATEKEIKTAFRKKAMKHHPDRGGDEDTFKKIERAKDVLMDPQKRQVYDRYGEEGLEKGGGGGGHDIFDLFRGGPQRQSGPRKPKPITQTLDITLEDVFKGSAIERKWKIKTATSRKVCDECDGRGSVRVTIRQGSMLLQTQRPCENCGGRGSALKNEKIVEKKEKIHVPHGIKTGGKITIHGEGHKLPDYSPGDVVFNVRVAKHAVFTRDGADIGCEQNLTLQEALCGYDFELKHLSGKYLRFKSTEGEIVSPGSLKVLQGFGLPQKGNRLVKGKLYIRFTVTFPLSKSLDTAKIKALDSTLNDVDWPEFEKEEELGPGSRVEVKLAANAAERIYNERKAMTATGVICDARLEDRDAWPVELDALDDDSEAKTVVVPASWVTAAKAKPRRNSSLSRSRSRKNKTQEEKDREDEMEDVHLEDVPKGKKPKATPASGGQAAQEEEEQEGREGGVQCQQM